jgi:hypothetical protein
MGADIPENGGASDNVNPKFSSFPLIRCLGHFCGYSGCNKNYIRGN